MNNAPKDKAASRSRRLIVRTNDDESARIRANAQAAGLGVSEYVRQVATAGHIVVKQESAYATSLATQLRHVGINLNQLMPIAHSTGEIPRELTGVCAKLDEIFDRILRIT